MNASSPLQALARYCGIADDYHDIWGNLHPTSDDTRRALLAAMHLPVAEQDAAGILQALEDAAWLRPLPPVHVFRCDEPIAIELSLPAPLAALTWRWTLRLENGDTSSGALVPAQRPPTGTRRLDDTPYCRHLFDLAPIDSPGYHFLEIESPSGVQADMSLIIAPAACYQPEGLRCEGRVWGPAVQLYGLRSRRNWGIGDFTDLRNLVALTAEAGGGIVGLSPLHALFPDNPAHISPYSPSSRSALNVLHIDIEAMAEFGECADARERVASPDFQARLRSLRAEKLVNYPAVAAAKGELLDLLWQHFCDHHLARGSAHAQAFLGYRSEGGEALERLARFEALQADFRAQDPSIWGWPVWPTAYRDPSATAVAEFALSHANQVAFRAWLQWTADAQLCEAGRQSWRLGLGVGLYADLAVGVAPGGADSWGWQDIYARGAHAGAPPDDFNLNGQDWGLPPFVPHRLREAAYAPFIEMLRANMRHTGALRIDHVMGLSRLFWVPAGAVASEGAYVTYPLEDLLGILALESVRNSCLVVGEDLGTVPEGLRPRLADAGLLSYHPLLFERRVDGSFRAPAEFPRQALAAASTHDLPTLAGLWKGRDIDLQASLGLFPSGYQHERMVIERAQDRAHLLVALHSEGLLPPGVPLHPEAVPELTPALVAAIHAYLARTPCQVLVIQPEDVLGSIEQANLPGSPNDRHPNWRRRLALDLEAWCDDPRFAALRDAMRRERGSS